MSIILHKRIPSMDQGDDKGTNDEGPTPMPLIPSEEIQRLVTESLKLWRKYQKSLLGRSIIKAVARIGVYVFCLITYAFSLLQLEISCTADWRSSPQSIANVMGTTNLVPCDRGYDVFDANDEGFDVLTGDLCAVNHSLTIDADSCTGGVGALTILKPPLALFVDVSFGGIDYLDFNRGKAGLNATPAGELVIDDDCLVKGHYIYPCQPEMMNIYNDTIMITDAEGVSVDISNDLLPLNYNWRPPEYMVTANLNHSDAILDTNSYEWINESIFPGRLENPRAQTWWFFRPRSLIDPYFQISGVEPLPIGVYNTSELMLPLTVDVTDRWFASFMPAEFTKRIRLTSYGLSLSYSVASFMAVAVSVALIGMDSIFIISRIIKIRSVRWILSKHQMPSWTSAAKNPWSDISTFRDRDSDAFYECGYDVNEAQRRVSHTARRRGSGLQMLHPEPPVHLYSRKDSGPFKQSSDILRSSLVPTIVESDQEENSRGDGTT